MSLDDFPANLAAARKSKGLSARALAEIVREHDIDRNRVTNLELGRGRPVSVAEILALAAALDCAPSALAGLVHRPH